MLLNRSLFIITLLTVTSIAQAESKTAGVILPLTGAGASYGVGCKNGITLGQEEFKEKTDGRLSFVFEDDQNVPSQTLTSLKKLRAINKSEFILTFASNTSNAINTLADKQGFILFALASDPLIVKDKKNAFIYWVTPDQEVNALTQELKRRNIKKIALFTGQQEAILEFKRLLLKQTPGSEIEAVFNEEFVPDDKDFRSYLSKVARIKNLDGIFNNLYIGQVGILAKQAHEQGLKVPIFNLELYESADAVETANGALEGQFFATASAGIKEFEKKYHERFPNDSIIAAANCYDYVGLLATAPELTVDGFRKYLETLKDYPGAAGKSSSTGDHRFSLPAVIKEVHGKEFVALER